MVGIATFDSTIHFYNLKRSQQQVWLFPVNVHLLFFALKLSFNAESF